jgi:DNA mismatch repair protein MutL
MKRIQPLPTLVINKIAAGEVIERPASVVKELLENSVDAGATRIDIEVEQGGSDLIRVVDNGHGIVRDDLPLAFAPHATSKLDSADDLFRIGTFGFRGEALASIGGVAQVTLQSRPAEQFCGAAVTCDGGEFSPVREWNGSVGTRIEVRHLFFNTPVRRKFLRTVSTEMGHLCEAFTRLTLAQPQLHLTLRHNNKVIYDVPPTANLLERITLFFGRELRDQVYPIDVKQGAVHLFGYIADPGFERGNARMQYFFINDRWIRDRMLGHALQEAYRGLLMTGRYAVAFLFLSMPPDHVDVNVHPTKAEVRFRDSGALYRLVHDTVRQRLSDENLTARLYATSTLANPQAQVVPPPEKLPIFERATPLPEPPVFPRLGQTVATPASGGHEPPDSSLPSGGSRLPLAQETAPPIPAPPPELLHNRGLSSTKAIQLYNAYLVLETPEGMLVIDQHALHERILFEQLKRRIRAGALETQRLLIPETLEVTAEQSAKTLEHQQALAELGLDVEDFGSGTVLLHSYPAMLGGRSPRDLLQGVVDHLCGKDKPPSREHLLNDILSLMACHSAVRAGDSLNQDEIAALIEQRELADDSHHCPHGRPTALLFSKHDLDRQFRRV